MMPLKVPARAQANSEQTRKGLSDGGAQPKDK